MKKFLLIIFVLLMAGCTGQISVTENIQGDCTSGNLIISNLTPTSLSLVTGVTKTFDASVNVHGTHCQGIYGAVSFGNGNGVTFYDVSVANNIDPWILKGISLNPALFTGSTGTISFYVYTADLRVSNTLFIPWAKL